ncbi:MAG TPA: hypothetical protein VEA15_08945, partial [Caulobacteraceae bacterium]|nr:hypothetical protein [Caulobacteraceae bacterium]
GAAGAPEGLRPAAPRLTKEAAATFGGFVSPAGREEAGGRGAAASGEEGRGRRGENFVVDPNPRTLPARLRTTSPFFYREGELARLAALFNHPRRDGMLVVLSGETLSGKTDLMRRFATTLAEQQGTGLALLHVDLAGANWPLRALFLSVRGPDQFTGPASGAGAGVPEEDDDLEDLQLRAAEFISSHIPHHLSGRRLVCFFERFHSIAGKQASVDQVRGILESGTFGAAFNILESRSPVSPTPGLPPVEIPLGAFEAPQAIEFLASLGIGRDPAGEALAMVPGEDILLPGILVGAANTFVGAPHPVSPPDLAMALIRTTSEIAWDAVKRVCDGDGLAPGPAMLSLMAISAFDGISMPRDMLEKVGLAEAPWRSLQRLDWARASEGVTLHGFGQDAVRAAATVVLAHDRDPLVRADELIQAIERVGMELFSDGRVRASPVLDGTVAWLKRHAPGASGLRSRLEAILEQDAVGDAVSPLPPEEEREAAPGFLQQGRDGDLDAGLAALLLYARAPYDLEAADGAQKAAFVDSLETATALVRGRGRLNARQLGALDTALFVGSRRFHLFQEALKAREAVIAALEAQEPEARAAADQTWIAAWLSLLLGAADGALGVGRIDDARALTTRAIRTVEETDSWWRPGSWKHWMLARLALLRERLAAGLAEQKAALLDAAEHGLECVLLTRGDPRCVRFYLRVVRRLVHTEREDPLRKEHVDAARLHLERILGASDRWNVSVRAQFAALMRVEARRAWDQLYQKTRATDALKLLWTGRAGGREEVEGEPRACLVQARLQAFLGDRPAALKSCNRSIELAPTPSAWNLKLRLLDGADGGERDWAGEPLLRLAGAAPGISGPLRAAIKELVEWTRQERAWTRSYGKVLLWTIQRKWRAQGSIERWVAQQAERRGISYATLQAAEKIKLLTPAHNQREAELKAIEKRFGPSIPLTLARFETKAQYIRSVSVVTGKEPDQDAALRVIDEGLARWPGSHILQFAKAEYQRYTWRHEAAIVGFRSVMGAATSGDLRRRAAAALARTLHIVAANLEEEETRTALLREAQALATELVRSDEDPQSIAILRDHIAFELGEEVDWSSLEDVFERVIGRIDGIRNILFGDFDDVLSQEGPAPESLAEALKTNYADPDTLGLAGLLYLRRAETGRGNNRPEDFRRAVALFRSEALIERSWEGSERAVTSFRNARAILSAAEAFGTVNPIEGLTTEGKADQLAVAEAKFNSTATRTTGDFRSAARKYQGIASRLGASLRAGP